MQEDNKLYIECLQKAAAEFEAKGNYARAFDYIKKIESLKNCFMKELIVLAQRWSKDFDKLAFYHNSFDFDAMRKALEDLNYSLITNPANTILIIKILRQICKKLWILYNIWAFVKWSMCIKHNAILRNLKGTLRLLNPSLQRYKLRCFDTPLSTGIKKII